MQLNVLLAVALLGSAAAGAQSFASFAAARDLAYLLETSSMGAFAVADPEQPARFLAVLYLPRRELRLVSVVHPSPADLVQRIRGGAYAEAYFELHQIALRRGLIVEDADADGLLHALPGSVAVDAVSEDGVTTRFNGDPQSQHVTAAMYDERFRRADRRYADALALLRAALERNDLK